MKVKILTVTLMLLIAAVAVSSQQVAPPTQQVAPPVQLTELGKRDLDLQQSVGLAYESLSYPDQAESDSKVLVIPGSEALSAEEMGVVVENMQIMSHIIGLKLNEGNLNPLGRRVPRGLDYWDLTSSRFGDDIESIYLEGFGALFLMNTNYSLVAPVEKAAEPVEEPKDALWSEVRKNITNPPTQTRSAFGGWSDALYSGGGARATVMEYSEEAVNKLKGTLLETLVHASNMSQVGDDEVIVVHVTGAPRMVQSQKDTDVEPEVTDTVGGAGVVRGLSSGTAVGLLSAPRLPRPAARAVVGKPTHLVIRAPMSEIKDLANDEIDFDTFKRNGSVVIY